MKLSSHESKVTFALIRRRTQQWRQLLTYAETNANATKAPLMSLLCHPDSNRSVYSATPEDCTGQTAM